VNELLSISATVNGKPREAVCEPRTLLVHFLRENLGLTGTHVGCDTSSCGACAVLLDGRPVKSCTVLAAQVAERDIVTVEGLAVAGQLGPVQESFAAHHAQQCGFCTSGFLIAATAVLADQHHAGGELTEATVRRALSGNLCRCTGYAHIVEAVLAAASAGADGRPSREER